MSTARACRARCGSMRNATGVRNNVPTVTRVCHTRARSQLQDRKRKLQLGEDDAQAAAKMPRQESLTVRGQVAPRRPPNPTHAPSAR